MSATAFVSSGLKGCMICVSIRRARGTCQLLGRYVVLNGEVLVAGVYFRKVGICADRLETELKMADGGLVLNSLYGHLSDASTGRSLSDKVATHIYPAS